MEVGSIDDIEVAPESDREPSPITKTEKLRRFTGEPLDGETQAQAWPTCTVSHPVREHRCGLGRVADRTAVSTAIGEPQNGTWCHEHLVESGVVAVREAKEW